MATEEVNKPPTLPQYPEMIFAAITALDDKNGSNKSSISNYIESQYGDLPPGHSTLLTHHLNKLKESGELVLVKNNYMRPDPNAPPKRGRGRPPKPKSSMPADVVTGPPRPRGRPPKAKDDSDPSSVAEKRKVPEPTGRGRGRPKKVKPDEEGEREGEGEGEGEDPEVPAAAAAAPPKVTTGSPRPRGRPPKVKAPFGTVGFE